MALSGNDNRAVTPSDNEGLVTLGVSRRGQQEHPGQHLGLAVEFLIPSAGGVDQLGQRVVLRVSGRIELGPLGEHGPATEQGVAAAVVEVQVTVGHQADPVQPGAGRDERIVQRLAAGSVVRVDLGIATHAGIEEQHTLRMVDEVPETGLHSRHSVPGFCGRSDEIPIVHPSHGRTTHMRQFDARDISGSERQATSIHRAWGTPCGAPRSGFGPDVRCVVMGTRTADRTAFSAILWLAIIVALGLGLGFLSLELIGVLLLPIVVPLLLKVAGRRRLATASLVTLVVGYELSVAAIAAAYIIQSLAGGFSVGNPANVTVLLLAIAAIGIFMLGVGLRFARRYDAAVM